MGIDASEVNALAADLFVAPAVVEVGSARAVSSTTRSTQHDAQRFAPVRTGLLRESIVATSDGLHGQVEALADYSGYVEEGTSDTAPQPFMRPAAELNAGRLADGVLDVAADIL